MGKGAQVLGTMMVSALLLVGCGAGQAPNNSLDAYPVATENSAEAAYPVDVAQAYPIATVTPRSDVMPGLIPSMASPVLGIVIDQNLTVTHVETGSGAAQAGVLIGDVLVSLDGLPFPRDRNAPERAAISAAIHEATPPLDLRLLRAGEELVLPITPRPMAPPDAPLTPTPVLPTEDYY